MMMNSRERQVEAKEEGESNDAKLGKAASTSSSRQWPGFRNPRIVRVSRSFGGKDRHSKVCTIRGLRDRRIRLSVPTAIQLYDLQDRLGLSQPSKVIDWLLDAAKYDIAKLPPLQIPQGFGHQLHQDHSNIAPFGEGQAAKYWDNNNIDAVAFRGKSKEFEKGNHSSQNVIAGYNDSSSSRAHNVSAHNLFPMGNIDHSSQNISNYYSLEPSNLSLSHFGILENPLGITAASTTSFLPSNSSGPQLFLCPPPALFHPYMNTTMVAESDPRQLNHIQLLSSTSQQMLPTKPRFHMEDDHKDKDRS